MKILLLQDVPKLGRKGDVVEASAGYAKNALFPKHIAKFADTQAIKQWEAQKERETKNELKKKEHVKELAPKLKAQTFQFTLPIGKEGEVFKSLQPQEIHDAILRFCKSEYPDFQAPDIILEIKPIKTTGEIKIPVKLGRGSDATQTQATIRILPEK